MATAIALQASSAPAVTAAPLTSDQHSRLLRHHRMSATTSPSASSLSNSPSSSLSANTTPSTTLGLLSRGLRRDGVSCDACLFRKSRCALNELVNKCYSCEFHRQDCTFTLANSNLPVSGETPQTKKRKLDQVVEINPNKRYDDIYWKTDRPVILTMPSGWRRTSYHCPNHLQQERCRDRRRVPARWPRPSCRTRPVNILA
jgi:hypothetical protein